MAESQAYPVAPSNGYTRSDGESLVSEYELKRKKRINKLAEINIQSLNYVPATPSFDATFTTQVRIKNTNWGPYKFNAGTATFLYQGATIGQVVIPKSKAGMRSTKKINVEERVGKLDIGMCNNVTTSIRGFIRETAIGRTKTTDRADRATVEKVLDFKTIFIIHKMMHRHVYEVIHGCISTGKEAHVYHAIDSDGKELAIKVFKTSVLDFKKINMENSSSSMEQQQQHGEQQGAGWSSSSSMENSREQDGAAWSKTR
ncbi:hypothetical protein ACLB2K_025329 [Fragaria x ananassa]